MSMIRPRTGSLLVATLAAALGLAPAAPGVHAAVPPGSPAAAIHRYLAPGETRAHLISGVLSGPRSGTPDAIARAYLATRPEPLGQVTVGALRTERTDVLGKGQGSLVRYVQQVAGVDVWGGLVVVR